MQYLKLSNKIWVTVVYRLINNGGFVLCVYRKKAYHVRI